MHFVLDQNFPYQATGIPWPPGITITALKDLDAALTRKHEDWEIFRALARRGDVDGFITNDSVILNQAREVGCLRTQS